DIALCCHYFDSLSPPHIDHILSLFPTQLSSDLSKLKERTPEISLRPCLKAVSSYTHAKFQISDACRNSQVGAGRHPRRPVILKSALAQVPSCRGRDDQP